jgi:uncharacterized membrane protein YeaQ/YmgE (transglycosylase-associated protein family)
MAILAWVMMSLAIWHFTVFLPDREWGGIVGAFMAALVGGVLFGFVVNAFGPPGRDDLSVLTSLEAVPGALLGIALVYWLGVRRERAATAS